jgi:hypothetical protein
MRFVHFLLPVAAIACTANSDTIIHDDSDGTGEDLECPNIEHIPVTSPQIIGQPVTVSANITDDSGVASVILYYKIETAILWEDIQFKGQGPDYTTEIPGEEVAGAGGMHYYIWAQDASPNLNSCTVPNDGPDGPFHFTIDSL